MICCFTVNSSTLRDDEISHVEKQSSWSYISTAYSDELNHFDSQSPNSVFSDFLARTHSFSPTPELVDLANSDSEIEDDVQEVLQVQTTATEPFTSNYQPLPSAFRPVKQKWSFSFQSSGACASNYDNSSDCSENKTTSNLVDTSLSSLQCFDQSESLTSDHIPKPSEPFPSPAILANNCIPFDLINSPNTLHSETMSSNDHLESLHVASCGKETNSLVIGKKRDASADLSEQTTKSNPTVSKLLKYTGE